MKSYIQDKEYPLVSPLEKWKYYNLWVKNPLISTANQHKETHKTITIVLIKTRLRLKKIERFYRL